MKEPFLLKNKVKKQAVTVYGNDKKAGRWTINTAGKKEIIIPGNYIIDALLIIQFKLPDAHSSRDVQGDMQERRRLGLAVKSVLIEAIINRD